MSALSEAGLQEQLKEAMRARDSERVMVLRGLVAAIKNLKIEKRGAAGGEDVPLVEADLMQLVRREIKQRDEAIGFAEQGGRAELVDKNRRERDLLAAFLPVAVSADDLRGAIERHYAAGANAIGPLMAKLKAELGSRLDGKAASEAVRKFLGEKEAS
jgi:uncharacterized protein